MVILHERSMAELMREWLRSWDQLNIGEHEQNRLETIEPLNTQATTFNQINQPTKCYKAKVFN